MLKKGNIMVAHFAHQQQSDCAVFRRTNRAPEEGKTAASGKVPEQRLKLPWVLASGIAAATGSLALTFTVGTRLRWVSVARTGCDCWSGPRDTNVSATRCD